jgi:hypothetical protein
MIPLLSVTSAPAALRLITVAVLFTVDFILSVPFPGAGRRAVYRAKKPCQRADSLTIQPSRGEKSRLYSALLFPIIDDDRNECDY